MENTRRIYINRTEKKATVVKVIGGRRSEEIISLDSRYLSEEEAIKKVVDWNPTAKVLEES